MKKITLLDNEYEVVEDEKNCINESEIGEKFTDYFEPFDYVVGDYAYDKLRLKGFYESNSPKKTEINDIKNVKKYIENYCSYGAKTFILKKIK